ncbi:MAG TPA: IS66 family insertion sequence element accessory protein TnpB [Candidatus Acidoferrales bacterium]|nr:IS66 family insertion sequence element accessory protein TnpB [Candidatus Acidoferrales bacterium]
MFALGPATRVYLATGATDMRKGFDGLYGMVRDRLELDPQSGHLFLFSNRRRTRLKLLCFDGSGLWVCAKRLERGRFRWPEPAAGERRLQLGAHELALLLGGMDLAAVRPRRWHRRAPSAA